MLKYDFSIESQEDEDLRCPICNYYFSNITKPYLLTCNHNLCLKCIDSIINKKMFSCPICRKGFTEEDRKNYQVNFAFLNLVIKILKTKTIFCKKCLKIYNWNEHHSVCDQSEFKEAHEIMEEIKKLAEESFKVIKYLDKHKNILIKSKKSIYENSNELIKIVNFKFYEHLQKTIESFFENVPDLNFEIFTRDVMNYLELCKPLSSTLNLGELKNISRNYLDDTNIGCDTTNEFSNNKIPIGSYSSNYISPNLSNNLSSKYFKQEKNALCEKDYNCSKKNMPNNSNNKNDSMSPLHLKSEAKVKRNQYKFESLLDDNTELNKTTDHIGIVSNFNIGKYLMNKSQVFKEKENEKGLNIIIKEKYENPHNYFDEENEYNEINDKNPEINKSIDENKNNNINNPEISDIEIEEHIPKNTSKNFIKINPPKTINMKVNRNDNLFIKNSDENNNQTSERTNNDQPNYSNTTNNTNIVNFNYNFNITELIDENSPNKDEEINVPLTTSNKGKQKIVVRNDKIEIFNVNKNKLNTTNLYDNIKNIANSPDLKKQIISRSSTAIEKNNLINTPNILFMKGLKPETPKSQHEIINKILSKFNKTKDIVQKVLNYTNQIEYTSETIKNQISTNYNLLNENIIRSMNSLCDNITVNFKSYQKKFLVNLIENTKKIWLFDIKKMKCEIKEFPSLNFTLRGASSVEYDDSDLIFLTGGKCRSSIFETDLNFSNVFIILRWSNKSIELISQMPRNRAFHSTIYFDSKLYVVGGASNIMNSVNSTLGNIRDTECYNLIDKRWELMPSMYYGSPSLCIYNGTYLYAFRGWSINKDENNFLDTIEYLNIKNVSQGWTLIKPEDPGMTWYSCSNSIAIVLSNDKILICGGFNNNTINSNFTNSSNGSNNSNSKYYNFTFIFDPIKKCVFRSKDLAKSACFNSNGTIYDNNVYLIDWKNETNKQYGVHIYDIQNNSWKFNQS